MELTILGSGGSTTTPRPGCDCRVCREARIKGIPYARSGPSMFIRDLNLLCDTPEEIATQLNRERIGCVESILYTHWHPDHTFGMRIVERMYKFWLDMFVNQENPKKKVKVYALHDVMDDLMSMGYRGGSFLKYYQRSNLIETIGLEDAEEVRINSFKITPFEVQTTYNPSTVFLIEEKGKRVAYAPCDVKPFPKTTRLRNLDLLIIGSFHLEGALKNGIAIPSGNPLRKELFTLKEIRELGTQLVARKTVVTHIEEEWNRTYDEYKDLEKEQRVTFAYDGMHIKL
ncbi:MAG: MBL fold metallo-hydrolase [Candidatus Bathyarchaeota archaeon]|nr:MAG: MBL fold metallo-hydrolase [Candidatus Bathyarchaeota archaeon]